MKIKTIFLLGLFTILAINAFAAIDITNRTAKVKIFMPDGKQIVVDKDKPLPTIPDGATITIMGGSATIVTTGKSTVSVTIGNYAVNVKEDSKVNLVLNKDKTVGATIILGQAEVLRKAEAYHEPTPPPREIDILKGEEKQIISPTT